MQNIKSEYNAIIIDDDDDNVKAETSNIAYQRKRKKKDNIQISSENIKQEEIEDIYLLKKKWKGNKCEFIIDETSDSFDKILIDLDEFRRNKDIKQELKEEEEEKIVKQEIIIKKEEYIETSSFYTPEHPTLWINRLNSYPKKCAQKNIITFSQLIAEDLQENSNLLR